MKVRFNPLRFDVAQRLGDVVHRVCPSNTWICEALAPRSVDETPQLVGEAGRDMAGRSSNKSNLMSSEHRSATVVQMGAGENCRHACIFVEALAHLQLIDRHTGEAGRRAILETMSTNISLLQPLQIESAMRHDRLCIFKHESWADHPRGTKSRFAIRCRAI